jgi:hypothetical protein
MKKVFGMAMVALIAGLVSCNKTEGEKPVTILVADVEFSMPEFPEEGYVLGTVEAEVSKGEPVFELVSQDIAGALAIDAQSGEISVVMSHYFEYDEVPVYSAIGRVSVGPINEEFLITVNLLPTSNAFGFIAINEDEHVIEIQGANFYLVENGVVGSYSYSAYVITDGMFTGAVPEDAGDWQNYAGAKYMIIMSLGAPTGQSLTSGNFVLHWEFFNASIGSYASFAVYTRDLGMYDYFQSFPIEPYMVVSANGQFGNGGNLVVNCSLELDERDGAGGVTLRQVILDMNIQGKVIDTGLL